MMARINRSLPLPRWLVPPRWTATGVAFFTLLMMPASAVHAGGTRDFSISNHADLDRGETEGAAIEATGRVTTGFLSEKGELSGASSAFSCLGRKDEVWVGTADAAAIHRVRTKGRGPSKGQLEVKRLVELDGVVVTAMAELPGGDVVVATLPGGALYKVDKRGTLSPFATLAVEQIWALQVHQGRLYAGTGPKAELYAMSLNGKDPQVVLDDSDRHIMTLMSVGDALLVGTAPGARLLRLGDDPKGIVLKDFGGDEVRAMALTRQGLLVAVNTFEDRQLGTVDALAKNLSRASLTTPPPTGDLRRQQPPKADAAVYHVDLGPARDFDRAAEAPWEQWFARDEQYFTSMLALDDVGTVLLASSAEGKLYRLRGPRDAATVADFDERQTTALCRMTAGPVFATVGQGAAAYQIQSAPASKALYRTKILDAKQPSDFGALVLQGSGPLRARARVGPSDEPDERWSPWQPIELKTEPGHRFRGDLSSVGRRRYLQVEISLEVPDAELRSLQQFYSPENLAPLITEIDVRRPGIKSDSDSESSAKVTIHWDVDARDNDDLIYGVRARPEGSGETQWIPLHDNDQPVTQKELAWDLSTVPDGVYEVEVVASDEPSNGAGHARTDGLIGPPFVVDRQRPRIENLQWNQGTLSATIRDKGGYVHDVAYRVDEGKFRAIAAVDGIYDEPTEALSFTPRGLRAGTHRVVIRARDSFGNIETAAIIVKVP